MLGKSTKTVRRWLDEGVLQAFYVEGIRFVDLGSVERYLKVGHLPYSLADRVGVIEGERRGS